VSSERITYLELLHRYCRQHGYALLLTALHDSRLGEQAAGRSRLVHLDIVDPGEGTTRQRQLRAGDLIARATVTDGVQAAAEQCIRALRRLESEAA